MLNASEKIALIEEFEKLAGIVNLGIRSGDNVAEVQLNSLLFENLKVDFKKNCPILTDILHDLFPYDKSCDRKGKGAIHALSLLASLKNKQCRNDITIVFSIMLISFGAGCRMVNMLNKVGLTLHWDTLMNFLDNQLKKKIDHVKSLTPLELPLLLLMDNINIYRGNNRHHRLFKAYGQNMWNFTVRSLFIPQYDEINHLFTCKETATQSQYDVTEFSCKNIVIKNNEEHLKIWENQVDDYLTLLLKNGLSFETSVPFKNMSESDCNNCLKYKRYNISNDLKITLSHSIDQSHSGIQSQTVILPLSLENNSTIAGTTVTLDQFGKEFSIPSVPKVESLLFDRSTKAFCFKKAREHVEFNLMVNHHKRITELNDKMTMQLSGDENDHELQDPINEDCSDGDCNANDDDQGSENGEDEFLFSANVSGQEMTTTLKSVQELFRKQDRIFNSTFDSLKNKF